MRLNPLCLPVITLSVKYHRASEASQRFTDETLQNLWILQLHFYGERFSFSIPLFSPPSSLHPFLHRPPSVSCNITPLLCNQANHMCGELSLFSSPVADLFEIHTCTGKNKCKCGYTENSDTHTKMHECHLCVNTHTQAHTHPTERPAVQRLAAHRSCLSCQVTWPVAIAKRHKTQHPSWINYGQK